MQIARTREELRDIITGWRLHAERIAFVPTMGNLHDGHIALVREAKKHAEHVVVSIYVNPTQFGPGEDFANYPRTEDADAVKLMAEGVACLFLPTDDVMYPGGTEQATFVEVPLLSSQLCGASRPGHFRGVATVVARLFNLVQPDIACFGEKDFQQLLVIRRMAHDLSFPVDIIGVPTLRETDGLAMSSRNQYLAPDERLRAAKLHETLRWAAGRIRDNGKVADSGMLADEAARTLTEAGFQPEYFEIRRAADLAPPTAGDRELVLLAAARLGKARLIDNLRLDL